MDSDQRPTGMAESASSGDSSSSLPVRSEVIASNQEDPVVRVLWFVIAFLLVVGLTGMIYVLMSGAVLDRTPATADEVQLSVAQAAVQANSEDGDAWSDYVTMLTHLERYSEAEREYKRGQKLLKGQNLLKLDLAKADLLGAEGKNDDSYELAKKLVDDYTKLETETLKAEAEKGIIVSPERVAPDVAVRVYLTAARAAGRLEEWEEVVSLLTTALKYDPLASDVLVVRGDAYLQLGKKAEARADFEQALTYIPDYAPALSGLEKAGEGE